MADQWRPLTNKKLHFARVQLDAWDRAEGPAVDSYREAYLFHAVSAYKSLIAEVMESYGMAVTGLPDLEWAIKQVAEKGWPSTELEQMKNLETGSGWLSSLLSAFAEISAPASTLTASLSESPGLIAVVNPDDMKLVSVAEGRSVLSSLKVQVDFIRNLNIEY